MASKAIARKLGRSDTFVRNVMKRNNLIVPHAIIEQRRLDSQFKAGRQPFNKGKKQSEYMSEEAIARSRATCFKKGHTPANTVEDMQITLRVHAKRRNQNYYYIKTRDQGWELLHRYIWRLAKGPIPENCNVQFKDGNPLNVTLDNLYLISRGDQAIINHRGGIKIPHELHETLLLIAQIKKEYEKHNHRPK